MSEKSLVIADKIIDFLLREAKEECTEISEASKRGERHPYRLILRQELAAIIDKEDPC